MNSLQELGQKIADARKQQRLGLIAVAAKACVSRTTLYLLESGRASDIGYSKLTRILAAIGLELRVEPLSSHRPTLDDLMKENDD